MRIDRLVFGILMFSLAACATAPRTASGRLDLTERADATLRIMRTKDPGLGALLQSAYGYAVFPEVRNGRGILYERGIKIGYVELNQGSIGAQLGGQTFSELIVFRSALDVAKLKEGDFLLGANASAVALREGASRSADLDDGIVVFTLARGGLMAELTVSGQELNYSPGG